MSTLAGPLTGSFEALLVINGIALPTPAITWPHFPHSRRRRSLQQPTLDEHFAVELRAGQPPAEQSHETPPRCPDER